MKRSLLWILAVLAVSVSLKAVKAESNEGSAVSEIELVVRQIETVGDAASRGQLSEKLVEAVDRAMKFGHVSNENMDMIAHLLQNDDYAVRGWAAMALGQIGPPARRVMPALERALPEAEAFDERYFRSGKFGPGASDMIRDAIEAIAQDRP